MIAEPRPPLFHRSDLLVGLPAYAVSSVLVLLAAWFGIAFVKPSFLPVQPNFDYWYALDRWDGTYYAQIARDGYTYDEGQRGVVAFFPAYPMLIRAALYLTGARVEIAAVVVAHILLALSCVLLHAFVRLRIGDPRSASLAVLSFSVLPTTAFFRFGYSESTFFFLVLLFLIGVERRWPWIILGIIAGAATATRAPGVALLPVLLIDLWRRYPEMVRFLPRACVALPLASWGLIAFILYQWQALGDPLAFVKIQQHWGLIEGSFEDTLVPLATYEPAWGTYDPNSPRHWGRAEFHGRGLFSILFANPIFYTGTLLLVIFGKWRRILNGSELILALMLLAIPYFSKGYTSSLGSCGRFAAVVVPVYLVAGGLLARLPTWVVGLLIAAGTFWLAIYAMMFTAGWQIT